MTAHTVDGLMALVDQYGQECGAVVMEEHGHQMQPHPDRTAAWNAIRAYAAALAGQAPKALSDDDVHCLIGHAEYLKIVKGQQDMPAYFYQLAERIALSIGDKPLADRVKELAAKNGLTLSAEPANKEQKREPIRRTGQANPRCN
jgi:hypothetical protein